MNWSPANHSFKRCDILQKEMQVISTFPAQKLCRSLLFTYAGFARCVAGTRCSTQIVNSFGQPAAEAIAGRCVEELKGYSELIETCGLNEKNPNLKPEFQGMAHDSQKMAERLSRFKELHFACRKQTELGSPDSMNAARKKLATASK